MPSCVEGVQMGCVDGGGFMHTGGELCNLYAGH